MSKKYTKFAFSFSAVTLFLFLVSKYYKSARNLEMVMDRQKAINQIGSETNNSFNTEKNELCQRNGLTYDKKTKKCSAPILTGIQDETLQGMQSLAAIKMGIRPLNFCTHYNSDSFSPTLYHLLKDIKSSENFSAGPLKHYAFHSSQVPNRLFRKFKKMEENLYHDWSFYPPNSCKKLIKPPHLILPFLESSPSQKKECVSLCRSWKKGHRSWDFYGAERKIFAGNKKFQCFCQTSERGRSRLESKACQIITFEGIPQGEPYQCLKVDPEDKQEQLKDIQLTLAGPNWQGGVIGGRFKELIGKLDQLQKLNNKTARKYIPRNSVLVKNIATVKNILLNKVLFLNYDLERTNHIITLQSQYLTTLTGLSKYFNQTLGELIRNEILKRKLSTTKQYPEKKKELQILEDEFAPLLYPNYTASDYSFYERTDISAYLGLFPLGAPRVNIIVPLYNRNEMRKERECRLRAIKAQGMVKECSKWSNKKNMLVYFKNKKAEILLK